MSNTDMTQAEELNLELELIFDNSPTFWHSGIGTDPEKRLDSPCGKWCIFDAFYAVFALFIPGMYGSAIFSPQLLGQPIEQPMTTNTFKHSPTEYNVRCGVIISSKRYACTHVRCMLDVPENSCVPLLTVTPATPPPPIFYWRRRRRKKIDRRSAAAGQNHPARRRQNTDVGAGLYVEHRLISKVMSRMIRFSYTVVHQFFNIAFTDRNDSFINYYYVQSKDNRAWN